jgi:formylglycine-generating enzyme required for sulfatase activity
MYCIDHGKRLCTAHEWEYVCQAASHQTYPYGAVYDPQACPTEGESVQRSGQYTQCGEGFGVMDMLGNTWEWIEDRDKRYPIMIGGSYRHGKGAHCGLTSTGTLNQKSETIGFRCCK